MRASNLACLADSRPQTMPLFKLDRTPLGHSEDRPNGLHDQYAAVRLLLESGADPNLCSLFGDRPRDIANAKGHGRLSILLNAFESRG